MEGHIAATWRMRLNYSVTVVTRLMPDYFFDHLLSFDMPTYTVPQIAERFEPNTVLWAFHTIQLSCFQFKIPFWWESAATVHEIY